MTKVVVVGMGTAGKSITLALAISNCDVFVVTRRGQEGLNDLTNYIKKVVDTHKLGKSNEEIMGRVYLLSSFGQMPNDVDLVIEAVKEDLAEKQELFRKLDSLCSPETIVSSTTSSLSITQIALLMSKPGRMIGLHFFNPAHVMELVEVIPGERTSPEILDNALKLVDKIDKVPIVVADEPGFLVNRLLFCLINEAINVLSEGKLPAEDIDKAMKLGAHHPAGPLRLADFIGLDVCLTILDNLYEKKGDARYKANELLREKVRQNNLGRKTGEGFYSYN